MDKPFVSFIVMAYNAEKFIQEALHGSFAQTYDNMEIIISDDFSTDKTFAIMQAEVAAYNGKHKVRLLRNQQNLGIGAHLNKLWFKEAKGDWIIVSAGDDVSLPQRVSRLMEVQNSSVSVIHHNCNTIDENSNNIPDPNRIDYSENLKIFEEGSVERIIETNQYLKGATMCLNKKMLNLFGPFEKNIVNEDVVLAYRAQYYGKIIYLEEKLMNYRAHSQSISFQHNPNIPQNYLSIKAKGAKHKIAIIDQIFKDNKILKLDPKFLSKLKTTRQNYEVDLFLYSDGVFQMTFLHGFQFYKNLLGRITYKPRLKFKRRSVIKNSLQE